MKYIIYGSMNNVQQLPTTTRPIASKRAKLSQQRRETIFFVVAAVKRVSSSSFLPFSFRARKTAHTHRSGPSRALLVVMQSSTRSNRGAAGVCALPFCGLITNIF